MENIALPKPGDVWESDTDRRTVRAVWPRSIVWVESDRRGKYPCVKCGSRADWHRWAKGATRVESGQ